VLGIPSEATNISIFQDGASIPLWRKGLGFDAAGLDFLTSRGREWYARRREVKKEIPA
jgi:hypothetical protein